MVKITFDAETGVLDTGVLNQWGRIPLEMRQRRQWAVSTLAPGPDGKPDKRPRLANGQEMEWRNPLQWLTYEEAISSGMPAIGYILSAADPFTIIDLDLKDENNEKDPARWTTPEQKERQGKIFQAFPSYAELSQSGRGLHIVLYGRIGGGINRDAVEVYDQDRYMICTGNVVTDGPIQSHPEMLDRLVEEMGGIRSVSQLPASEEQPAEDEVLIQRMENARNGERFKQLFYGPIDMGSENDAALFAILTFYTRNHDQILRLFARSALYRPRGEADGKKGHTAKSYHEKYLVETLARALNKQNEWTAAREGSADLEHGRQLAEALMARHNSAPAERPAIDMNWPAGLVGEIARYIYATSARPIKEVAIAGALSMMAGICGRQFNVSGGQGLNLYTILLGATGMGKEGAKNGVDRLFAAMAKEAPGTSVFLGPRVVSGPALEKAPAEHNPCFVSFFGEIGTRMQAWLSPRGGDPLMKAALLGLYTAAVRNGRHQGAFHSKKEDRTESITFPCITLFGESTQTEYYKAISGGNFDSGFVPRFLTLTIQSTEQPELNKAIGLPPSPALLQQLVSVAQYAIDLQVREQFIELPFAAGLSPKDVDDHYRVKVSQASDGPIRACWTRAGMHVMKVAGLLAVGENHLNPVIDSRHLAWASQLVEASVNELIHRQETGDLSSDDAKQIPALQEAIMQYPTLTEKQRRNRNVPVFMIEHGDLIPFQYIRHRLRDRAEFASSPRGLDATIMAAIQTALNLGQLQRVSEQQLIERLGRNVKFPVYCLGDGVTL